MANKRFIVGSSSSWQLKKENAHKKRKLGRGLEGKNDGGVDDWIVIVIEDTRTHSHRM